MATDPRVDLAFSHNMPRYEATGIDPNDLRALMERIGRWEDWCRVWSDEGARHEAMAREAAEKRHVVTAAEAFIRASSIITTANTSSPTIQRNFAWLMNHVAMLFGRRRKDGPAAGARRVSLQRLLYARLAA